MLALKILLSFPISVLIATLVGLLAGAFVGALTLCGKAIFLLVTQGFFNKTNGCMIGMPMASRAW